MPDLMSCRFRALVIALALALTAPPARAETLRPAPAPEAAGLILPDGSAGAPRSRVQLVWNNATLELERRRYELFDPLAEQGLDVFWEPRFPARDSAGPIEGEGILTWREPGAIRYGAETIVAQYRGMIRGGKMDGTGVFLHRSGLRYDGGWVAGGAEGQGHLLLPGGDVYSGGFRAGRIHGQGRYIAATGEIYEGGHAAGLRDGPGLVAEANGYLYAGVWMRGEELMAERGPAPAGWPGVTLAQGNADAPTELAISVSVGNRPAFCCGVDVEYPLLGYTTISTPERLYISPDAPELMDVWNGNANIVITDSVGFAWERNPLAQYRFGNLMVAPVSLQFGLENRSADPAQIVAAFLEFDESLPENAPLLQSLHTRPISNQRIEFSVENYGWGAAQDARLVFRFANPETGQQSDEMVIELGELTSVSKFTFLPSLTSLGLNAVALPDLERTCSSHKAGDEVGCLDDLRRSGVFGGLEPLIGIYDGGFGVMAEGWLAYDWTDGRGAVQHTEAPFRASVEIGGFLGRAECEGGWFEDLTDDGKPFMMKTQATTYRIPLPLRTEVPAGAVDRWQMEIEAPQSSSHSFRIVLQLADGRIVRSRPIEVLYLLPQVFPESVLPFQPIC